MVTIENRLREELRFRSLRLLYPHIGLVLLSLVILKRLPVQYPFYIIFSALIFRKYVFDYKYLFLAAVGACGLGWGLLIYNVVEHFGLYSTESLYALACALILMSSGITVFSAWLPACWTFQASIAILPVYVLFKAPGPSTYILGIFLVLNVIYQFYHSYISYRFLKKSIKNEVAVTTQNQTLQQFMDSIPGLVTLINDEGQFLMVNNYLDGAFKNIITTRVEDFFPKSELTMKLLAFLESKKNSEVHEVKFSDFGEENWYVLNLSRITSPENGIIAVILPITDLVKAKNDLKIQEARSQYAAKLASLGEVSAGIAHEVNNPLTIIEGAANLMKVILEEGPVDKDALLKVNKKIMDTTHRIAKIIKSLRALAVNADVDPFKNVSFQSIIEPCLEITKAKLDAHGIDLRINSPEVDVQLFGNEIQLCQVVMNLVSNAIDAVKDCPSPRWIEIRYVPTLEWLDIFIIDNGVGIAPENKARIMEAFFTTKDSSHGTGLGLSISKNIIDSHHGSLELLESEYTMFRMRFPRMTVWQNLKKTS